MPESRFCRKPMAKAVMHVVFVFACLGHALAFNAPSLPPKLKLGKGCTAVGASASWKRWSCGMDRAFSVEKGKKAQQWPNIDFFGVLGKGQKEGNQEDIRAGLKARLKAAVELRQGGESRRLVESYLVREPLHTLATEQGSLPANFTGPKRDDTRTKVSPAQPSQTLRHPKREGGREEGGRERE